MSYERVKKNWCDGLWTLWHLQLAYKKGVITMEQLEEIKALPQKGQGK